MPKGKKEFGVISVKEARDFYLTLGRVLDQFVKDSELLESRYEKFNVHFSWYPLYEIREGQLAGYLLYVLGMKPILESSKNSSDLIENLIELINSDFSPPTDLSDLDQQTIVNLLGCLICLTANMECYAAYKTSIQQLMNEAKEGCSRSLFMAINIDETLVCSKTAGGIEGHNTYFSRLGMAPNLIRICVVVFRR